VKFLTSDVEDIDERILALEVKINVFLKDDYKALTRQYEEVSDRISELKEFKNVLIIQIDTLNEQFKMDVIDKFSKLDVVTKCKEISFDAIGAELNQLEQFK
jgi:antirestriction protein ArdC